MEGIWAQGWRGTNLLIFLRTSKGFNFHVKSLKYIQKLLEGIIFLSIKKTKYNKFYIHFYFKFITVRKILFSELLEIVNLLRKSFTCLH